MENYVSDHVNETEDGSKQDLKYCTKKIETSVAKHQPTSLDEWTERYDEIFYFFIGIFVSLVSEVVAEILGTGGTLIVAIVLLILIAFVVHRKTRSLN